MKALIIKWNIFLRFSWLNFSLFLAVFHLPGSNSNNNNSNNTLLTFATFKKLVLWEFRTTCFNHIHIPSSLPKSIFITVSIFSSVNTNLFCPNILGCVWSSTRVLLVLQGLHSWENCLSLSQQLRVWIVYKQPFPCWDLIWHGLQGLCMLLQLLWAHVYSALLCSAVTLFPCSHSPPLAFTL